jgi:general secretion pathway protein D
MPSPVSGAVNVAISANIQVTIVADEPTNSLLIRANPRDYRQLLATISQLDVAPLQVMINAVIAQIVLSDDSSFGVDWSRVLENAASGSVTNVSTGFLPTPRTGETSGLGGLLFNRAFIDGAARVDATLEAIAVNNDVRLLARPSLTVINNMEGLIRIGAEVPVQLGETIGVGGSSTTNIQYRPTGIELNITPRINDDGVVNLTIRQELSSVSESSGVGNNPIFENQEIETTVVVRDGENVVLGGLIQSSNNSFNTGVPGLNRVPGLGRLFSYQRDNNERRELFIVLRPEIVNLNSQNDANFRAILSRFEMAAELIDGQ